MGAENAVKLENRAFEANYHVEPLEGRSRVEVYEFRRQRRLSGSGELILETVAKSRMFEVIPRDGEPWVGDFECGPGGTSGLYATPCADELCIVLEGQGFWIPVLNPAAFELIRSIPIKEVHAVPKGSMLVFVDFTRLAAYGANGLLWQTERLSWDGLEIIQVDEDVIRGLAWDSPTDQKVPFTVDTRSGTSEGGSSPARYVPGPTSQ